MKKQENKGVTTPAELIIKRHPGTHPNSDLYENTEYQDFRWTTVVVKKKKKKEYNIVYCELKTIMYAICDEVGENTLFVPSYIITILLI